MRFVTFQHDGFAAPGVILGNNVVGLRSAGFPTLLSVIEGGFEARQRVQAWLDGKQPAGEVVPLAKARLLAPLPRPPKIICVGLNYRDHAEETGMPIPEAPIVFAKATSCISGPNDPILIPKGWQRMDFEVELAFAIGSVAKNVSEADALSYVAGYMIADDVSERSLQKGGPGEWIKAKSYDSFGPLGPWLVTKDEVPDPQALGLALDLNGTRMQTGNTSTMIFSVAHLVSYISGFMTLMPGDVITTGTPPGVGMARNPRVFLKEGDQLTLTVEGLGEQRHTVVAEA
jgi:2-keto-4-pentenoate hydratase/2-oxohepta-3-ene-1,7-dioic acid hydratase in catechol pathway